ncbi:MAG: hypothetical protein NTZ05_10625 [Chloroflexi bacterium]|nr:hypothetical protein [Chloroflexota bacterium]
MRPGEERIAGSSDRGEIRRNLGEEINAQVTDALWEYLVERDYVGKVRTGEWTVGQLGDEAEEILAAGNIAVHRSDRRVRLHPPVGQPLDDPKDNDALRYWVVEELVADEAASEMSVRDFRTKHLGDGLLAPEDLEQWVRRQSEADGPPTNWITVPIPTGHQVWEEELHRIPGGPAIVRTVIDPPLLVEYPHGSADVRLLAYSAPPEWDPRTVPVAGWGVLAELKRAGDLLHWRYGWTQGQATVFLLTGLRPDLPAVTESVRRRSPTVLNRITLTVDPVLSPREVGAHYSRIRERVVGSRHREQTRKHLLLAYFPTTPLAKEAGTWAERMERWNEWSKSSPDMAYTVWRTFERDCIQARKRLLDAFPWRRRTQPMNNGVSGDQAATGREQEGEARDGEG